MNNTIDRQVDIIIPIYNALDDLKKCVKSVVAHTDLKKHRLILIDDQSPDQEIQKYLKTLTDDGIYTVQNNQNLGFSGTVNKGLLMSEKSDVVLLNSDTMVTPGWLEKLLECAYSDQGIATVTPLSNNASICSVPFSNKDNELPDNMPLEEYAAELERISMKQYPDIPMGIGFCLLIKRSVIDEAGLFDSEAFGRGYGEENDFCNRATELGYRHVMCDTTFIYHKGSASFEENSKEILGKAHEGILEERYPQLNRRLEWYWAYQQNGAVHKNARLFSELSLGKDKKNIFYLIQADFQEGTSNNIGGTQLHVKDLTYGLKKQYNIFVAARDGEFLRVTAYIGEKTIPLKFYIGPMPLFYVYRDQKMADLYENVLSAFKIDLVHIHHTMGLTLELYYVAEKLGIPVYVSLHDYYYLCPTLRMIDTEKTSCLGEVDWDKCRKCMKKAFGVCEKVDFMQKWRKEHEKVLKICQKVFAPSESAAEILEGYYPFLAEKIQVIPHGIDKQIFAKEEERKPYSHTGFHVAFVGGICETKGSEVIYQMITKGRQDISWFIFGGIDGEELNYLRQKNLTKTGWYQRTELKDLLKTHEIDVVCILSTVAETYCYTLSEVVACGVPAVVTDIGALGARMREMECGWIVKKGARWDEVTELLSEIRKDRKDYGEKWHRVQEYAVRTSDEMVEDYQRVYLQLKKLKGEKREYNPSCILNGYLAGTHEDAVAPLDDGMNARVQMLENELRVIHDSEIFKIMKRIARLVDRCKALGRRVRRR